MKDSIKKYEGFDKIYREKNCFATKYLVMYISKNSAMERNRLGISVSHNVGNSVVRHTLTRRMREIFRQNNDKLEQGYYIVVVFRKGSENCEFFKLNEDYLKLCKKHKLIKHKIAKEPKD